MEDFGSCFHDDAQRVARLYPGDAEFSFLSHRDAQRFCSSSAVV